MRKAWRIIATGILLLVACSQDKMPAGEVPGKTEASEPHEEVGSEPTGFVSFEEASRLGPMKVQPAALRSLSGTVTATGEVQYNPQKLAHLMARVSGWVQEVTAFQEDAVVKGEILALIDSPEYLTAQTEYLMALRRSKLTLSPDESRTAQALLTSARQKLLLLGAGEGDVELLSNAVTPQRYLPVRSPLDGTVVESNVVTGNAIRTGDDLYQIADLSTLWVILDILEQDLARVRNGLSVKISTAAFPDEKFQGTLTLLSQTAKEATRTVQARVVVANDHWRLRPGMFVQANIETLGGARVVSVPESAVFLYQGQESVFVQTKDGYQAIAIKTNRRQGEWIEILDGLESGTPTVVEGGFLLKAQLMKESMGEGHVH
ncbi:MAG: efflux RND transporter periplasmic adaptor subunit [Nitrospira sp.]|nr:efflux RND transporter periplasmic adaptor subunit [Nitrospira sp.]